MTNQHSSYATTPAQAVSSPQLDQAGGTTQLSENQVCQTSSTDKQAKKSAFWRMAKIWAYILVFIYSCLRALPLIFVDEFYGSVLVVWLMDVVTAFPYTWGIIAFVTGAGKLQRYAGFVVALGTFAAPYVYFWTHGDSYPIGVTLTVIAMILGGIGVEVYKYMKHKTQCTECAEPARNKKTAHSTHPRSSSRDAYR